MQDDARLLEHYARERAEEAFAELVRRHINLVYTAALRQTGGHAPTAEDVTQQVFAELARQAGRLIRHPALSGWLYTTTRNLALRAGRSEQRRLLREQEAEMIRETASDAEPAPDWNRFAPVLDEAMHELNEKDRQAILLRYFQGAEFRAVGVALGLSDGAARMRVERALDKLREGLSRRGIVSTTSTLTAALATQAILTAPATLAAVITASALATVAVATPTTWGILQFMALTKAKTVIIAGVTAALASGVYVQTRSLNRARAEVPGLSASSVPQTPEAVRPVPAQAKQPFAPAIADYTGDVWPLDSIRPGGNDSALAGVKTAIAAVLGGDFTSFHALRSTNSVAWSSNEAKAREVFARLVTNHQDVKEFRIEMFRVFPPGPTPTTCRYSIERTRATRPGEEMAFKLTLRPEVDGWKIDRFAPARY